MSASNTTTLLTSCDNKEARRPFLLPTPTGDHQPWGMHHHLYSFLCLYTHALKNPMEMFQDATLSLSHRVLVIHKLWGTLPIHHHHLCSFYLHPMSWKVVD